MPTLFKRSNGIYYAILTDAAGRRKWISTGERTKTVALKQLASITEQAKETVRSKTIKEFLSEFLDYAKCVYSAGNLGIHERVIQTFIRLVGNFKLDAVTQRDVDLFKAKRLTGVKGTTVNIELRTLRAAFYTALRWKLVQENPFKQVELCAIDEETPAYLSAKDLLKLLSTIPDTTFREFYLVAALTGLRRGELINLRWEDVDMTNQVLYVRSHGKFRTKGGKRRVVGIHPQVAKVLARRFQEGKDGTIFLANGRPLKPVTGVENPLQLNELESSCTCMLTYLPIDFCEIDPAYSALLSE